MNEVATLSGTEPREILQTIIEKKVPAVLSFLSKGKWHVAKVLLTNLGANRLDIRISPRKTDSILRKTRETTHPKPPPLNIQINQPVGISLKYEYGKFIFETTVVALEHPSEPTSSGENPTISLRVPDLIEMIQRRSYFRVDVPGSLKVKVLLWHCRYADSSGRSPRCDRIATGSPAQQTVPPERYWQGKLIDISAGGVQIVIDSEQKPDSSGEAFLSGETEFKRGQFVGLRFTPMPYEMPLMFDAQIRNILPTTRKGICLGLRIVGLEASPEGRQILQRLCNVVEHYYQINQCSAKQADLQTTGSPR